MASTHVGNVGSVDLVPPPLAMRSSKPFAGDFGARTLRVDDCERADVLRIIEDERNTNRAIKQVRDAYGLKHLTFVVARYGQEPAKDPYVRTTYPSTWMARYLFKRYWRIDPIIRAGFSRARPFDWDEIERDRPEITRFFEDAKAHNIGESGLLIPMTNKLGQRGILSVNSDLTGSAWRDYKAERLPDFLEIAVALHRRGVAEVFGDAAPPPRLSPREKEMLVWVAEGKEVPDITIITGLSEHTVRTYLKTARLKLQCGTMTQAAVKAERFGLLTL